MRLSGKSKLLKKTAVGAASSRDRFNSRLEAAPTNIQYTGSFQITGKIILTGFGQRNLFCLDLLIFINKMLIEYEHNVYCCHHNSFKDHDHRIGI